MEGQMRSYNFIFLTLSVVTFFHTIRATFPKENFLSASHHRSNLDAHESLRSSLTHPKPVFPQHLEIRSLENMPLVILYPNEPINFKLTSAEGLRAIHKNLTVDKVYELLEAAMRSHNKPAPENSSKKEKRNNGNEYLEDHQPKAAMNHANFAESQFNDLALPRSLGNPNMNNGLFQRFRGTFSNMFPRFRPSNGGPFPLGLPSMNVPTFLPQPSNMHGIVSSFSASPFQQFQSWPWRKPNFHPLSAGHIGDLNTGASYLSPLRAMFSNLPIIGRPGGYSHPGFAGGLATSGSAFIPRHILPPPRFIQPTPPIHRHKPLFNDFDSLQAASMEISNAFADFTDSKEHGPEVTQRFGSVGHTITNFLKMMGLGSDLSFGSAGGFGGGADMAALESAPIARSSDFYPGYGNQAHFDDLENLDDIDDFPIFQEDITKDFMKKMNITNETMIDNEKKIQEMIEKDVKITEMEELMKKEKVPVIKEMMTKDHDEKPKKNVEKDVHTPADPQQKEKNEKVSTKKDHPSVNYKIPPILSTVAPQDRKQPVAIYQNFNRQDNSEPKSPVYVPAQAMPHREEEENPNKLVDDDVVRQWRLVNSGRGYVEKHPVPILDILQNSKQPESLKVVQKVISDTVKKDSA